MTIDASAAKAAGSAPPEGVTAPNRGSHTNWAGNYTFAAPQVESPTDAAEVQRIVSAAEHAKPLGSGHCFNDIADTPGTQLAMRRIGGMELDREAGTVTVGAGVRYGDLAPWLDGEGFAVHNLASLPHITVIGACATATHGSGLHNGNLATAVEAIELVDGRGELHRLSRAQTPEIFSGCVVAMGALGVVTRTTLRIVPRFEMAQAVYEDLPFGELESNLEPIFGAGYSVSLFTDWQGQRAKQVWVKRRVSAEAPAAPPEATFFGATLQTRKLHPVPGVSPEPCTEQFGVPGPWYERLPHFRMNFTPSSGDEIQSECFVPLEHAYPAVLAVERLRDRITPHLFVSELRTVAADDLWMSMSYGRDSLGIHFTWRPEPEAVRAVLPAIEEALRPFSVRPHWGKVNAVPAAELRAAYPRYDDFAALMRRFDPDGRFRNAYLDRVFPLTSSRCIADLNRL